MRQLDHIAISLSLPLLNSLNDTRQDFLVIAFCFVKESEIHFMVFILFLEMQQAFKILIV